MGTGQFGDDPRAYDPITQWEYGKQMFVGGALFIRFSREPGKGL